MLASTIEATRSLLLQAITGQWYYLHRLYQSWPAQRPPLNLRFPGSRQNPEMQRETRLTGLAYSAALLDSGLIFPLTSALMEN